MAFDFDGNRDDFDTITDAQLAAEDARVIQATIDDDAAELADMDARVTEALAVMATPEWQATRALDEKVRASLARYRRAAAIDKQK